MSPTRRLYMTAFRHSLYFCVCSLVAANGPRDERQHRTVLYIDTTTHGSQLVQCTACGAVRGRADALHLALQATSLVQTPQAQAHVVHRPAAGGTGLQDDAKKQLVSFVGMSPPQPGRSMQNTHQCLQESWKEAGAALCVTGIKVARRTAPQKQRAGQEQKQQSCPTRPRHRSHHAHATHAKPTTPLTNDTDYQSTTHPRAHPHTQTRCVLHRDVGAHTRQQRLTNGQITAGLSSAVHAAVSTPETVPADAAIVADQHKEQSSHAAPRVCDALHCTKHEAHSVPSAGA